MEQGVRGGGGAWISLVGFMACGKSACAEALAAGALLPTVDLDEEIERRARRSVPEIFAAEGLAGFRVRECEALAALPAARPLVVATGGGVVENGDLPALLRARGVVVWLDAPWEVLRARIEAGGAARRPLVGHLGWEGLARLYGRRLPLYAAAAHFRLRSDLGSPAALGRAVLACGRRWRERAEARA